MEKQEIIDVVTKLLSKNFGDYTADLYNQHYQKKEVEQILASANELLSEILGPEKAKLELSHIYNKEESI